MGGAGEGGLGVWGGGKGWLGGDARARKAAMDLSQMWAEDQTGVEAEAS